MIKIPFPEPRILPNIKVSDDIVTNAIKSLWINNIFINQDFFDKINEINKSNIKLLKQISKLVEPLNKVIHNFTTNAKLFNEIFDRYKNNNIAVIWYFESSFYIDIVDFNNVENTKNKLLKIYTKNNYLFLKQLINSWNIEGNRKEIFLDIISYIKYAKKIKRNINPIILPFLFSQFEYIVRETLKGKDTFQNTEPRISGSDKNKEKIYEELKEKELNLSIITKIFSSNHNDKSDIYNRHNNVHWYVVYNNDDFFVLNLLIILDSLIKNFK